VSGAPGRRGGRAHDAARARHADGERLAKGAGLAAVDRADAGRNPGGDLRDRETGRRQRRTLRGRDPGRQAARAVEEAGRLPGGAGEENTGGETGIDSGLSLPLVGLLLGASVASGLRLYATVAVLGLLGRAGALVLPGELKVLENPWVIGVAAALYLVEFLADKIPVVDSVWDLVHTFIRVPAASLLAWAAASSVSGEWRIRGALLCGGVAL